MPSTASSSARDGSSAEDCAGSTTTRHTRWPTRPETSRPISTTADGLFSGKAGLLYRLTDDANLYLSYGSAVTPPGTANFTLSSQPNNQNNPNVDPQESTNYEVGGKFGVFDNRLSVSMAAFRTDNKNVIYHDRRHRHSAALQPGRRAEGQRLLDRRARADHAAMAAARELRLSRLEAGQSEPGEQRQATDVDARVLGQPVDHLRLSRAAHDRRRPAVDGRSVRQRPEHDSRPRLQPRRRDGGVRRQRRTCRCGST